MVEKWVSVHGNVHSYHRGGGSRMGELQRGYTYFKPLSRACHSVGREAKGARAETFISVASSFMHHSSRTN